MDKHLTGFDEAASKALTEYHWPGNLRQMKNMVRRATLLATGKFITMNELSDLQQTANTPTANISLRNEETENNIFWKPYARPATTKAARPRCWESTARRYTTN